MSNVRIHIRQGDEAEQRTVEVRITLFQTKALRFGSKFDTWGYPYQNNKTPN